MKRVPSWLLLMTAVTASSASTTTTWEMNSYQDFVRGRFGNVALSRDGRLTLAPKLEAVFASEQPEIWSVAKGPDGSLYLGTGHRGRLYKVDATGRGTLLWTAEQPEIFAVAVDRAGTVYAATSPDGRVYRIENGKGVEFFAPGARYIWALAFASDGSLFVGTGDQGKIFQVTPEGKGRVYFESGQQNITALAVDSEGRLLAGSDPNGILYRLTGPNKAFVLYDANLPEIRSILPSSDGTVYIAALGGSTAKRSGNAANSTGTTGGTVITAPATSITVTDSGAAAQAGEIKPPKPEAPKPATQQQTQPATAVVSTVTTVDASVEKSAIYKIHSDNTVETMWSSKDENIYDLAALDNGLIFSTDLQGRIYRLPADRKAALMAQTGESETLRLLSTPSGLLAATGNMGKIYKLVTGLAAEGFYEAPVHDSNTVARWGRLSWHADPNQKNAVVFRTRSGNSARPDNTWSDWSAPMSEPSGSPVLSPNARYVQWRAEFKPSGSVAPVIDSVSVAYVPQNTPPNVRSINVTMQPKPAPQSTAATNTASNTAFSVTVTDTGDSPQSSAGTPTQTLLRGSQQQTQISWQADDPDGDRLVYTLYFRGEDEHEWKLLRANLFENSLALDSDILADGRYYFRVIGSDRPSNPREYAKESELISAPVLIDNTPPVVRAGNPRKSGSTVEVTVEATDQTSPLRRCEYSFDANAWIPVEAADGVTDSPSETFQIRVENVRPGEHLLVIRVYDSAGNAGLTKVLIQ